MNTDEILSQPIILESNNSVSISRTPWAGFDLGNNYKDKILPSWKGEKLGEIWEISADSEYPSKLLNTKLNLFSLIEVIKKKHESQLSSKEKIFKNFDLLIKLLNASESLSVQVHPDDNFVGLQQDECGKHESWLVLNTTKNGAGIYLGLKEGVSCQQLIDYARTYSDIKEILNFFPVQKGDYIDIAPGTIHSLGPDVTVLEPQKIPFGKKGKTFRVFDWNRRYTKEGFRDDQKGFKRELHINQAIATLNQKISYSPLKKKPIEQAKFYLNTNTIRIFSYPQNGIYHVLHTYLDNNSHVSCRIDHGYFCAFIIKGSIKLEHNKIIKKLIKGQSFILLQNDSAYKFMSQNKSEFIITKTCSTEIAWF